jgi:hypothetical protein
MTTRRAAEARVSLRAVATCANSLRVPGENPASMHMEARRTPNAPTGARRARFAKRAQLVFGLVAAGAMLYRMFSRYFE